MLGAIIGDIVGSRFEWNNYRAKDFEFFHKKCFFTDDSIMTLAIAKALIECNENYDKLSDYAVKYMRKIGGPYPYSGYGGRFYEWMYSKTPAPYYSFGNGSAMRVSACGFVAKTLDEVKELSHKVTCVTHNHPEGLKGAEATAVAVFLAKTGSSKEKIKKFIERNYYSMDFMIDDIRDTYEFNETCQDTVPQAIKAFLESNSFVDAIRIAISVGGDSDTLACITGGIAEAYYGISEDIKEVAKSYLDEKLLKILEEFYQKFPFNK